MPPPPTSTAFEPVVADTSPTVERGTCYVSFAFDIGFSIDLELASRHIGTTRETLRLHHRAPQHFRYTPAPLRVRQAAAPLRLGEHRTRGDVDYVVYDFGAASVTYQVPLEGPFARLVPLSELLYENAELIADARQKVGALLAAIEPAVRRARLADLVEDMVVWHVQAVTPRVPVEAWAAQHADVIAQVLRSEQQPLSRQEIDETLRCRIAYTAQELTIVDWNGALCLQEEADDVRSVLEFANVELLEMRFLDDRLDTILERAYERLPVQRRRWLRKGPLDQDLRRLAELQMDSALLFEAVNNTLKLLGDHYLARVYRLASQRLHLADQDASILRKLQTVESIYAKLHDAQTTRRMELLEWIIIVLIAISLVLPFLPGGGH